MLRSRRAKPDLIRHIHASEREKKKKEGRMLEMNTLVDRCRCLSLSLSFYRSRCQLISAQMKSKREGRRWFCIHLLWHIKIERGRAEGGGEDGGKPIYRRALSLSLFFLSSSPASLLLLLPLLAASRSFSQNCSTATQTAVLLYPASFITSFFFFSISSILFSSPTARSLIYLYILLKFV